MSQINDQIRATLTAEGFGNNAASLSDVVNLWLISAIVGPVTKFTTINLWDQYLTEQGFVGGSITKRRLAFFQANGATSNDYDDAELQYWTLRAIP